MKFLILFALALATASAFDLRGNNIKSRSSITNGNKAAVGQFPYQVGLYSAGGWCGGCLIDNSWILTAAHCTKGRKKVYVYLGATDRNSPNVTYTVNGSAIINHAGFNRRTLANDIALVKIPSTNFNNLVNKVNLPANASSYPAYDGSYAIASGWGRTSYNSTGGTNNLQWARMLVITNDKCTDTFGSIVVTPSVICTDTPSVSTCQGDSGGPLVLESTNTLIGVTSFAGGCELETPSGYTRVTSYLNWIKCKTDVAY